MDWYLAVMSKYADFGGRSRRKEYWMFALIYGIVYLGVFILALAGPQSIKTPALILLSVIALAHLIPSLAVSVRRLHDTGRTGWWFLLLFVPLGGIAVLIFMCLDGEFGSNDYGPNPKNLAFPT